MRESSLAMCAVGVLIAFVAAAAHAGGMPGDFTPHGSQPGLSFGLDGSSTCEQCHRRDGTESAVFPFGTWGGSMKANAGRDPLFWAALDVANADAPGVGDWCLRCHSPGGWYAGRVRKTAMGPPVEGTDGCRLTGDHDNADNASNDYAGVGCHYCHRLRDTSATGQSVPFGSGNRYVEDSATCNGEPGPCRSGPYRYPDPAVPVAAPHAWEFSLETATSEFCGACHDISSPDTDVGPVKTLLVAGVDTGLPFPAERTYREWRLSAFADRLFADGFREDEPRTPRDRFGDTCQSCHMASSTDPLARACQQNPTGSRVGQLPLHEFAGANAWIPQVIKVTYGGATPLGTRAAEFDRTSALATDMLTTRSATVEATLDAFGGPGNTLTARVRVTNLAGHKLPTGYGEGRRMWLQAEARDADGDLLWESGHYDDATAALTQDAQAKVYEVLQGIWDAGDMACETEDAMGRGVFHFVRNDCIRKDNRIPPRGFRGGTDVETRPVSHIYPETAPGSGVLVHWDDTVYAIPVPGNATPPIAFTVRLKHQVASREYVEFLRDQAVERGFPSENDLCADDRGPLSTGPRTVSRGQFMHDLWSTQGRSPPVTMQTDLVSTP